MNFLVARAEKHFWEEPVISGRQGSGTIFFGGCSLRCVFCQNHQISRGNSSLSVNSNQLIYLMRMLEDDGAHNINLVSPSHYASQLPRVLEAAKKYVNIPIVYNSSGYDRLEDLKKLDGLIDIYLPDLKYVSSQLSLRYSKRADYFSVASRAIAEMRRQQPLDIFDNSIMQRGVIVRHLILPSLTNDSKAAMQFLAGLDRQIYISLMAQYFPCGDLISFPELNRRINQSEYESVCDYFFVLGLSNGFTQELDSAIEDYVPDFDIGRLKQKISSAELRYSH